jgi:hypothetical protein
VNQMELNERARDMFVRVRQSRRFLSVYDMPTDLAEAAYGQ